MLTFGCGPLRKGGRNAACERRTTRNEQNSRRGQNRHRRLYLGKDVYPRGLRGGTALSVHCFLPHFEHRIRLATSSSRESQPQSRPRVCGSVVRSWPQAEHFSTRVYWPNSSLNLWTWNSRGTPPIFGRAGRSVHPVRRSVDYCTGRALGLRGRVRGLHYLHGAA